MYKTIDEFTDKYTLCANKIDKNAAWEGVLYDTSPAEWEIVKQQLATDWKKVWTLVEEDGDLGVCLGLRIVNRLGYFITTEAAESEDETYWDIHEEEDELFES